MGFNEMIGIANSAVIARLGGETFTARLNGVFIKTMQGLFNEAVETVSPHDAETVVIRPAVTFHQVDFDGLGKTHTFTRDKAGTGYRIFGEPQPDGAGMTRVFLVKA